MSETTLRSVFQQPPCDLVLALPPLIPLLLTLALQVSSYNTPPRRQMASPPTGSADNQQPTITILSPSPAVQYALGDPILLTARSYHPEEGDLSSSIFWSSNQQGPLGQGSSLTINSLSPGRHIITAAVSDSAGRSATASVELEIAPQKESSFDDVPPDHPFYPEIEALRNAGYAFGCSSAPPRFCPEKAVTRAEGAVFLVRGLHGPDFIPSLPPAPPFPDVALEAWYAHWVNELVKGGYAAGCSTDPPLFCPERAHTRAEAAVLFLRILQGPDYQPPAPKGYFADVDPEAWYADWVDAAWEAGIAEACGEDPLRYCPEDPLTRAAAAYMMAHTKTLPWAWQRGKDGKP